MGLLSLLTMPITGPVKGFMFIIKQIHQYVEKELYDESRLQKKLLQLRMNYERGNIEEKEYKESEAKILNRIKIARKRQKEILKEAEGQMENLNKGQMSSLGGLQVKLREDEENEGE
ncbi:MAG: gas vesicle protein GvpG [Halanaerobiales bacterium]|nr:gas vesicle protein GvpG [Halanaerobiales bacterium]